MSTQSTRRIVTFDDFCNKKVRQWELFRKTGKETKSKTETVTITKYYKRGPNQKPREDQLISSLQKELKFEIEVPTYEEVNIGDARELCNAFIEKTKKKEKELTNSIQSRNTALVVTAPTVTLAGTGLGLAIPKLLRWAKLLFAK